MPVARVGRVDRVFPGLLRDPQALAGAVQARAPKLTPAQARAALGPVLDKVGSATDPEALRALAGAVGALAPKLSAEAAEAARGPILDPLRGATRAGATALSLGSSHRKTRLAPHTRFR